MHIGSVECQRPPELQAIAPQSPMHGASIQVIAKERGKRDGGEFNPSFKAAAYGLSNAATNAPTSAGSSVPPDGAARSAQGS